jgi:CubicO group peptidase (beta-lactamase class C family)
VSGIPYTDLVQERLLRPLKMERTTFDTTVAMTYPLAQGHSRAADGAVQVRHRFHDSAAFAPCGGALSTVRDLAPFALLHLHQGRFQEQQLLTPASITAMHTAQAPATAYGLTFGLDTYKGVRWVEHDGAAIGFGCQFVLAPDEGVAVILPYK